MFECAHEVKRLTQPLLTAAQELGLRNAFLALHVHLAGERRYLLIDAARSLARDGLKAVSRIHQDALLALSRRAIRREAPAPSGTWSRCLW
jgi:hypothetical protein